MIATDPAMALRPWPVPSTANEGEEEIMFRKLFILIAAASALAACDNQVGSVVTPPLAKTGTPNPEQAPVSFMVFFPLGSTKLGSDDQSAIAQAAQVYKTRQNARVAVTGYADTVGSPATNMALSQQRADAVKGLLVNAGVPAAAITTSASGDTGLLVPTGTQANEARNRRVVIVIQ
jgi:outer membrane protein OmpA-like peptidoglycan-associated protein